MMSPAPQLRQESPAFERLNDVVTVFLVHDVVTVGSYLYLDTAGGMRYHAKMKIEWDPDKARLNLRFQSGIRRFARTFP
jgi:hypothetical protein